MNILDYLQSKGFNLHKRGSVYQMLCPFKDKHIDHNASFTVYPHTNSFFCFGCGTGGSIQYLIKYFNDPIPQELLDNTKKNYNVIVIKNQKKSIYQKCISIILLAKKLRKRYKDQYLLNKRVKFALDYLEKIYENTTFR